MSEIIKNINKKYCENLIIGNVYINYTPDKIIYVDSCISHSEWCKGFKTKIVYCGSENDKLFFVKLDNPYNPISISNNDFNSIIEIIKNKEFGKCNYVIDIDSLNNIIKFVFDEKRVSQFEFPVDSNILDDKSRWNEIHILYNYDDSKSIVKQKETKIFNKDMFHDFDEVIVIYGDKSVRKIHINDVIITDNFITIINKNVIDEVYEITIYDVINNKVTIDKNVIILY
jgi:hypothetical protein